MTKDEKIKKLSDALKFYANFNTYYNKIYIPELSGDGIPEGILQDLIYDNYWGVSLPGKLAQETLDCIYPFEAKRVEMSNQAWKNYSIHAQKKNTEKPESNPIEDIRSYLDMMNALNDPEEDKRKEILFRRF